MKTKLPLVLAMALFFPVGANAKDLAGHGVSIAFGVVPQQSASRLAAVWTPILGYLSDKTGYAFHFKTARDIPTFEQRLAAAQYDIAYMNPYHYVAFNRRPGYRVFAMEKDVSLGGIVVVAKRSHISSISQLNGKTIAFPAPAAFAATLLVRAQLGREGVRVAPKFVSSHDSVYQAVAKGMYPAGGGVMRTLENLDPTLRSRLRVLWSTDTYPPHAIAAHRRLPTAVIQKIQEAMFHMHEDPTGRELLKAASFKGITAARDSDYERVRALGFDRLERLPQ